jgi:homoserine O-acetyltransferase
MVIPHYPEKAHNDLRAPKYCESSRKNGILWVLIPTHGGSLIPMSNSSTADTHVGSAGIVETQYYDLPEPLLLNCGKTLGSIRLAYETYGQLNADKSNCILILHALTGDAHVAGYHAEDEKQAGWWDTMVGAGKAFNTDKYFVLCSNVIGGCKGSTGPSSMNPATGNPYALDFPMVTIPDMVNAQQSLVKHLGIEQLLCVVGGSMGGMQVLQWTVAYPEMVRLAIPIATTARLSPQAIAFDAVGRHAILADPNWNNGNYYDGEPPSSGLSLARMVGHITYLSDKSMHQKFGRDLQDKISPDYNFQTEFQVESYLNYKGDLFVKRFDANSYLYITRAMDYFDLAEPSGSLAKELSRATAAFLVVSFSSDWLFSTYMSKEIVSALRRNNLDVSYAEIQSDYGHDAFLLEVESLSRLIVNFLEYANPDSKRFDEY